MTAPDTPLDRLLEHRPWVRDLVRSIVLDQSRADDVEQQVWLTAVRHGGGGIDTPRAWLATVARNWARRAHRGASRSARREAAAARPEATESDGDSPLVRAEAHREVVDAVLALPEPLRLAVLHHYFDGLSVADVAKRLGVPHETVRSRLRLARGRLRERLGPKDAVAAWSPALLALGGLPKDFAVGTGTTALTGGTIAMTAAQKLAIALVVPAAVGAAWVTTRAAAPDPSEDRAAEVARLEERLDRMEKNAAAAKPARSGDDRGLARRLDAVEARLDEQARAPAAPQPVAPKTAAAPAPASPDDASNANASKDDSKKEHLEIVAALKGKPGSPEHLAALKRLADWLVKSAGPPAVDKEVAWAQALFDTEARGDRVTPAEAAELSRELDRLPPGHAARTGIAAGVAGGWATDPRLSDFLARFPTNSEPRVHAELLVLLDHKPSAVFGDYVLRLVREERDPIVLASALKNDRVAAATTGETALRFAQTVDARMLDGSLDLRMRSHAACAIAVAGLRAPESCAELLGRIAGRESDARLAQNCRDAASALTDKSATAKTLEKMFR